MSDRIKVNLALFILYTESQVLIADICISSDGRVCKATREIKIIKELADLLDRGQIKSHVGRVFSLEQARQAQELKRNGHIQGKIVLKIAD